ncbi:MAG: hypothetical protein ACI4R9_09250 [Kiritimatiellia bacterium]
MKRLSLLVLLVLAAFGPAESPAGIRHDARRIEPHSLSPRQADIPGLQVLCQTLAPAFAVHGVPVYTLTFDNEQHVRRTLTVELEQGGVVQREIVLEPSARLSVDFVPPALPNSGLWDSCAVYILWEEGTGERILYHSGAGTVFSAYSAGEFINVLIGSAVDGIGTAADYSHEDERAAGKGRAAISPNCFHFYTQSMGEAGWSADTRAYSGYDIVMLSAAEWAGLAADVRRALVGFAAQGGVLILCGQTTLPTEARGFLFASAPTHPSDHVVGFGRLVLAPSIGIKCRPPLPRAELVRLGTAARQRLLQTSGKSADLRDALANPPSLTLPVVPTWLFITLLAGFALVLVPAVLWLCIRRGRRIAALVLLPVVSAGVGCVIICAIFAIYGITPQLTERAVVLLNAADRRAFVRTRACLFAPTEVTGRLRFARGAQVMRINGERCTGREPVDLRLVDGTEMSAQGKDWLRPLCPIAYITCEMRDTNARLVVEETAVGKIRVTNLLGAGLTALWVVDGAGSIYAGENLAEGATCELAAKDPAASGLVLQIVQSELDEPDTGGTRSYFRAEMAACPFGTDTLGGAKAKRIRRTVVYGRYGKEGVR